MAVRQYIGSRYVPIFGRIGETSIAWDNSAPYEPLTVVTYQGNSYISRQAVPTGIEITNTDYWAEVGNYNAQIEAYREEVLRFDGRISECENDIATNEANIAVNATDIGTNATAIENLSTSTTQRFTATNTNVQNLQNYNKKRVLLFGDSWCTFQDKALESGLRSIGRYDFLKNYGVSGARIAQLSTQFQTAINDTSFDHSSISDIFIVAGTNNVYWNNEITYTDARNVITPLKTEFSQSRIHYFPNNSRTQNGKRNRWYHVIMNGFSAAGVINHPQTLMLPYYSNMSNYNGTDTSGVQHLTSIGYYNLASWIDGLAFGADFSDYQIQFEVPMQWASGSSITGTIESYFAGTVNGGILQIHISGITYNSGFSAASPGTARFGLSDATSGSETTPIVFNGTGYTRAAPCCANVTNILAFAIAESSQQITVPLTPMSGTAVTSLDIVIPLFNPLGVSA